MKKLSYFILAIIFSSGLLQAQRTLETKKICSCNPNGFNPFVASIGRTINTVKSGHQFNLNCGQLIKINGGYKCVEICNVKFVAIVKNSWGATIQNYSTFSFPWTYSFATAGNYSLEITPICGNTKCPPSIFYFTVTCPTVPLVCNCQENGWYSFISTIGKNAPLKVNCGYQFSIKKNLLFKLEGKYACKQYCVAKYIAVLKNTVTGAIIKNSSPIKLPWFNAFPYPGNYQLEITPICAEKKCQPCVFYFTVL